MKHWPFSAFWVQHQYRQDDSEDPTVAHELNMRERLIVRFAFAEFKAVTFIFFGLLWGFCAYAALNYGEMAGLLGFAGAVLIIVVLFRWVRSH